MNPNDKDNAANTEPEILVNAYDPSVVAVDEPGRTVFLTEEDTIVIEKEPHIEIVPSNRPRKVYGGMWGQAELAAFGASLLTVLAVLALYLFWVVPSNREMEQNRAERERLNQELISTRAKYGDITSTETQVAKLVSSVDDFESRYLPVAANGRTSLYQRINGLLAGYGLVNTNGPNFAPLEMDEATQQNGTEQNDQERGRAKFRSIFPGVYVTMTVEGSYQNLRRFIREIETGNEFVVISSIELEPTETKAKERDPSQPPPTMDQPFASNTRVIGSGRNPQFQPPPVQQGPPRPQGKMHGETVSLRLELVAYFRRANMTPTEPVQ